MSLPPDLQVLCRRLASADPTELPLLCPSLISHVRRCQAVLSLASDQKPKDGTPEHSVLAHKLKTQITTLLNNGRSQPGRFSAAILIKAVVDVGGYECLRTSEPWVRGLLSIVQKNDPYPAKEIAIITLTRIYVLLHEYQGLVREIASPTLASFVTACLQLIKSPASSKSGPPILRLVETIGNALCVVTPLYPTTLRPSSAQVKAAFRAYVAPTSSDRLVVPESLKVASRQILILQHYTTPKNGNSDEWGKTTTALIKASHFTADQVFRAVQESWESNSGYIRQQISSEGEPHGGSDSTDDFPPWTGLYSGAERLIGLVETLAEVLRCPTKTSITAPISAILDLTARISMILPPQRGVRGQDGTQLNSAIGREEKDELWSVLPDIHVAIMDLLVCLIQRFKENVVPIAADMLHQTVRIFDTQQQVPLIRERCYVLVREVLRLHGPTMPKLSVNSLDKIIQSNCRDLLSAVGYATPKTVTTMSKSQAGKAAKPSSNADAYLTTTNKGTAAAIDFSPSHIGAASALLATFPSHLPQQHLKQTLRALIDRTAVLSHNRDAMVSSVLNPYRTGTGKTLASVFPFLVRDFPWDQAVEVLRSNLRTASTSGLVVPDEGDDDEVLLAQLQGDASAGQEADEKELVAVGAAEDEEMADGETEAAAEVAPAGFDLSRIQRPAKESTEVVTETVVTETTDDHIKHTLMLSSTLKRKSEELDEPPAKRIDTGKAPEIIDTKMDVDETGHKDSDSDSDESVHLDGTLEDDEDEDEN